MTHFDQGNRGHGKRMKGLPIVAAAAILSATSSVSISASHTTTAPRLLPDPIKAEHPAENLLVSEIREFGPWSKKTTDDASNDQAAVAPAPVFVVRSGDSLFSTIESWARQSGWQVSWEVKTDYIVGAEARFSGAFEDAMNALITSLGGEVAALKVEMYAGNKVVRITEYNKPNKE